MKILHLLLALLISATVAASVNPYDLLVRADASTQTLTLRMTTNVAEETLVLLQDHRGGELFRKTLRSGDYLSLRFDLATLEEGDYALVIRDSRGCTTQPVHIGTGGVTAEPEDAVRYFYPVCRLVNDHTLSVNYLNQRDQRVVIRLSDEAGNEVFSETINGDTPIQRAYRLDGLQDGNYVVSIRARTFRQHDTRFALK